MPELYFALFVKRLLALLTGVLYIVFENLPGEARPPTRNGRAPTRPPNEQHVFLWRLCAFVEYGTAARSHNMPELRFALFVKQGNHGYLSRYGLYLCLSAQRPLVCSSCSAAPRPSLVSAR